MIDHVVGSGSVTAFVPVSSPEMTTLAGNLVNSLAPKYDQQVGEAYWRIVLLSVTCPRFLELAHELYLERAGQLPG